jgi:glycosyltransferase involved in cell wall biosynthesis
MNILFLSSYYPPHTRGGGELSTHYIARGLQDADHTVSVITNGPAMSQETLDGIAIIRLPAGLTDKPLFEKRAAIKAAKIIKRHISNTDYDVIHAHDFRTALALSHMNFPQSVITLRDYAAISGCTNNFSANGTIEPGCVGWHEAFTCHRVAEASFPRNIARAWQYAYNMPYRGRQLLSFSKQIYISQAQRNIITSRHPIANAATQVIYNPVPPEFLAPLQPRTNSGNVVYVGTVEMYKGVGLLLQAWKRLAKQMPNIHLTIVGGGAQRQAYEKQVAVWGLQYRINFTGKLAWDRLKNVYDQADVVVAPHLWAEPFGRTIVEAMSRGAIVVASDAGGAPELIQDNATGFLFERASRQSLEDTLRKAISLPAMQKNVMRQAGHAWVANNLSLKTIAQQHEQFYLKPSARL